MEKRPWMRFLRIPLPLQLLDFALVHLGLFAEAIQPGLIPSFLVKLMIVGVNLDVVLIFWRCTEGMDETERPLSSDGRRKRWIAIVVVALNLLLPFVVYPLALASRHADVPPAHSPSGQLLDEQLGRQLAAQYRRLHRELADRHVCDSVWAG